MRCGGTSRSQTLLLNRVCVHVLRAIYSSTFTRVRVLYSSEIPIFSDKFLSEKRRIVF